MSEKVKDQKKKKYVCNECGYKMEELLPTCPECGTEFETLDKNNTIVVNKSSFISVKDKKKASIIGVISLVLFSLSYCFLPFFPIFNNSIFQSIIVLVNLTSIVLAIVDRVKYPNYDFARYIIIIEIAMIITLTIICLLVLQACHQIVVTCQGMECS